MIDVRLTATNPEDSTLVPVPCNSRGELLTVAPKIESIPNDVEINGDLTVTGTINGAVFPSPPDPPDENGGIDLPPDPYEGALLGWLNGGLAWIGTPPVEIADNVFGPITGWDPSGLISVEGGIPDTVTTGVYVYQCNEDGSIYVGGWDNSQNWSDRVSVAGGWRATDPIENAFNGDNANMSIAQTARETVTIDLSGTLSGTLAVNVQQMGSAQANIVVNSGTPNSVTKPWPTVDGPVDFGYVGEINTIELVPVSTVSVNLVSIMVNGAILVDSGEYPSAPNLNLRVQSVNGQNIIGAANRTDNFTTGKYLRVPEQKVARWLYDGALAKLITTTTFNVPS